MHSLGVAYLALVFVATLWGGLVVGPQRIVPFLILAQTMLLPSGIDMPLPLVPDLDKVTAVTLPALLLFLVTKRETWAQYRTAWPDLFVFMFVIWAALSVLLNNGPYAAVARVLLLGTTMIVPYVAGRLYLRTSEDLFQLVKAITPLLLVYLLLMVIEARLSPILASKLFGTWAMSDYRLGVYRPVVLASGSLELGHYMVLVTILIAGAGRGWRGLEMPLPSLQRFGVLAAGLGACLSVSRGPIMGLALAFLTPYVLKNTRWLGAALGLGGLAFFLWLLGPVTGIEVASYLVGEDASTQGTIGQTVAFRFFQIDVFEPMVHERPWLGWGESFERAGETVFIDGILLLHTLCYGFPGGILLMLFWTAVAFYIGRAAYRGNSPFAHIGQLLAPVIGWHAFSAWGDSFLREPYLLIMSAAVGGLIAEKRLRRPLMPPLHKMVFVSG